MIIVFDVVCLCAVYYMWCEYVHWVMEDQLNEESKKKSDVDSLS